MEIRAGILIFVLSALTATAHAFDVERRVARVTDGDTFEFESLDKEVSATHTCRMLGYDAPEKYVWEGGTWRKTNNPQAQQASERLAELISGKTVRIEAKRTDRYGRWLCEVWRGDVKINDLMRHYLKDPSGLDKYH